MTTTTSDEFLAHFGVKGMKWGTTRKTETSSTRQERRQARKNLKPVAERLFDDMFANSAISQQTYASMSKQKVVIKRGAELYRVEHKKFENVPYANMTYVSTNQADRTRYRATMPGKSLAGGARTYRGKYNELTLRATKQLSSPSEQERVDIFSELMDTRAVKVGNKTLTGREYLARTGYREVKKLDSHRAGLKFYNDFARDQGVGTSVALNKPYFDLVRKRGYNALIDDNDAKKFSKEPLIVLDPHGTIKKMSVHQLTDREIVDAQREFKITDYTPR